MTTLAHLPVKVNFKKVNDQWRLEFRAYEMSEDTEELLNTEIPNWITRHVMNLNSPLHHAVSAAHPFVQGRYKDWLLIEFWTSDIEKIMLVVHFLMGRFEFRPEPFNSDPL